MAGDQHPKRFPAIDFDFFLNSIRDNAFIPIPDGGRIFTGGDHTDFRQAGVDALRSLVTLGGVAQTSRVLEIGCGLGRVALPLTQWLTSGTYTGIDVAMEGIAWCHEFIARKYSNFRFIHFDLYNEFYNPTGRGLVADVRLPFGDRSHDVVFLNSVFTHLDLPDIRAYLREIARVLAHGGHLWGSWFLVDDNVGRAVLDGRSQVPVRWTNGTGVYYANENKGTVAVALEEKLVFNLLEECGFARKLVTKGTWIKGRTTVHGGFQDIIVCTKG